jgi:cytochrome c553
MTQHQYAVDLMYRGLAAPSDEDWTKGTKALAGSPLGGKALPEATESLAAEKKVHELANAAAKANDRSARITAYGEVIGSCASCHGLHGRVLGPGVPKAE